jgi:GNAT superfamily N-acetyltransferase
LTTGGEASFDASRIEYPVSSTRVSGGSPRRESGQIIRNPVARLRKLELADMEAAALVHRAAFDRALPWLAGLHTPQEDRWFFRERVLGSCEVWGAFGDSAMIGVIAFREGWIDQLYVLPQAQGQDVGGSLLQIAKCSCASLQLWTFQRNFPARRFYEARRFVLIEETDGARNEEKEPDVRYLWVTPA